MKILPFRKELRAMMQELAMEPEYGQRYLNVGFSGGEKKRAEILQLLMLKPTLALLDETDSGLDVDAVQIVSEGVARFHTAENACLIITALEVFLWDCPHEHDDSVIQLAGLAVRDTAMATCVN